MYVVEIPDNQLAYLDLWNCYKLNQTPWLMLIPTSAFPYVFNTLRDQRSVFLLWTHGMLPYLPYERHATVFSMYFEAYDEDRSKLAPDHLRDLESFVSHADRLDAVGCHTPWMAEQLGRTTSRQSFVLPYGYDHRCMGPPDWDAPKDHEAMFYGSMVGKRLSLIEKVSSFGMGKGLHIGTSYGSVLYDYLNRSKVNINLYHYDVQSYSTWRLFQSACSSAALLTEDGDIWPASRESMLMLPEHVTVETAYGHIVCRINDLSHEDALRTARSLAEDLSRFTTRHCIDEYLVKGTAGLLRS
jgi:hypothetical protein